MYHQYPTRSGPPPRAPRARDTDGTYTNPWLLWRPESAEEAGPLTVAELDECRCPGLCNRDHVNE